MTSTVKALYKVGDIVMHLKTKGRYAITVSSEIGRLEASNTPAYSYQEAGNPSAPIFHRSATEMEDGRFVLMPTQFEEGVETVVKYLQTKADNYAKEHGYDDMGSLSFGSGKHAEAKADYHNTLLELIEEIQALANADSADTNPIGADQSERKEPICNRCKHLVWGLEDAWCSVQNGSVCLHDFNAQNVPTKDRVERFESRTPQK